MQTVYHYLPINPVMSGVPEKEINRLGSDGWELTNILHVNTYAAIYVFRKQITTEKTEEEK